MAYPSLEQYNLAFQLHSRLLSDPELRAGTVATTGLGLPLAISGGFALTYTINAGSKKYAVRCFHRESKALEKRYDAISTRLASLHSPFFLDFQFQPKGISVEGASYPIVKMAWARGKTLGEFLEDNRHDRQALAKLSSSLVKLAAFLEKEKIAHGDFQTGNLMVSDGGATVQLIDYDGMYVDGIKALGSAELGHVNFQHPQRKSANPFDPTLDRFSLISIWLALKALQEDPSIWDKTNSEVDAVVFRANDFSDPGASSALAIVSSQKSLEVDAKNFAAICASPMVNSPSLADFIAGQSIPLLASVINITGLAPAGRSKPGYISAYEVLPALNYEACFRRVGDKVEVIGKIVEVNFNKARNGKPYIFVNFGNWRGRIFKISIWSEGLDALRPQPDTTWVGKWISVVGLMEPPFVSNKYKYSHLSITVTTAGQLNIITEENARWRLSGSRDASVAPSISLNRETLERITGRPSQAATPAPPALRASSNKDILDKIRATTQPPQTQTTMPQPTRRPTQPHYVRPQPPQKKGVVTKIFEWLFS
ncbi:protein kinase family protein [Pseudomonas sp.]|uniref:protein kinase family protein n=1 Tax=Pseudomonas sp. TaxID=306 RepID=UPI00272FEC6F|nr:protein kinase family protein [Pseudomonas sp.]MDP2243603.1 protein kinase family protein [Pseudomonas sp.]